MIFIRANSHRQREYLKRLEIRKHTYTHIDWNKIKRTDYVIIHDEDIEKVRHIKGITVFKNKPKLK